MASALKSLWVPLVLLSVHGGTAVTGRALDSSGFARRPVDAGFRPFSRADRRWRRDSAETARRDRCAQQLDAVWRENVQQAQRDDEAVVLQLRGRLVSPAGSSSHGLLFPGRPLFNFVRKVYQCCQEGALCSRVRGIQGRTRGDREVEFLFSREVLSLTVTRAELHLQIFNPLHLDVRPLLPSRAGDNVPTRYSLWSEGTRVELRVDLLFLLRDLQEKGGGVGGGGGHSRVNMPWTALSSSQSPLELRPPSPALQEAPGQRSGQGEGVFTRLPDLELRLVLSCSRGGEAASCRSGGVELSHAPFMALYYS